MRITVEPGGNLIGLWDASLLRRLVANLVGNALKYSPTDQPVEVNVGPGEGPTARVVFRDKGIGMAPDELDRSSNGSPGRTGRATRGRRGSVSACMPAAAS